MAERIGPGLQRLYSLYTGFNDLEFSSSVPDDFSPPKEVPAPSAVWGTRLQGGEVWLDLVAVVDRSRSLPDGMIVDTEVGIEPEYTRAFVTARVPLAAIGAVMESAAFEFVDTPSPIRLELDVSGPEVGFPAVHADPASPRTGSGVMVGVVDRGVDVTHPGFCDAAGHSRILWLWDQGLTPVGAEAWPPGKQYGVGWHAGDIDAGLLAGRHAGSTHGTQVAGIVAGNGRDSGGAVTAYVGGAPDAQIVVAAVDAVELSNSKHVLDAVSWVFTMAMGYGYPAVVNLSMGDPSGPHDGTAQLEQFLARLTGPGRLIVKSAGNGGGNGGHAACDIDAVAPVDLCFDIPVGGPPLQCVEVWYPQGALLDIQVVPPGAPASRPVLANSPQAALQCGASLVTVLSEVGCLCNGDNCITVSLIGAPLLTQGTWALRLINHGPWTHADAWFRAARKDPVFLPPVRDDDVTITSPCAMADLITVGSYSVSAPTAGDLSDFSSRGPTRNGLPAPTLTAPGESVTTCVPVTAATGYAPAPRGTSFAAPHVTAAVALMLQNHPTATPQEVIDCLTSAARPPGQGAATGWGAGKLDVAAAVACLDNKLGP
jgi:subtilisin family serine protease